MLETPCVFCTIAISLGTNWKPFAANLFRFILCPQTAIAPFVWKFVLIDYGRAEVSFVNGISIRVRRDGCIYPLTLHPLTTQSATVRRCVNKGRTLSDPKRTVLLKHVERLSRVWKHTVCQRTSETIYKFQIQSYSFIEIKYNIYIQTNISSIIVTFKIGFK